MLEHTTLAMKRGSGRTRTNWVARAITLTLVLGVTVAVQPAHADHVSCTHSSTITPAGSHGSSVSIEWGGVWPDGCTPASTGIGWSWVEEGTLTFVFDVSSPNCSGAPTPFCTAPWTHPELLAPGEYDVWIMVVGSDVWPLFHELMETITITIEPCGTFVGSDFHTNQLGALEFFDQTFGGVGTYEAINGSARLFTTEAITANIGEGLGLGISDSLENPELYADGTVRLAFRSATSHPLVQIGARLGASGLLFSAASAPFDFVIVQRSNPDGSVTVLGESAMPINPDTDYEMRATFVGDLVELTVWHAGDPEPAPQISVIDPMPTSGGGALYFGAARSEQVDLLDASFSHFTFTLPDECEEPVLGDLNGDGVVDGADLGILLNGWGDDGAADLNGDGVVDGADLGLLLNNWG